MKNIALYVKAKKNMNFIKFAAAVSSVPAVVCYYANKALCDARIRSIEKTSKTMKENTFKEQETRRANGDDCVFLFDYCASEIARIAKWEDAQLKRQAEWQKIAFYRRIYTEAPRIQYNDL